MRVEARSAARTIETPWFDRLLPAGHCERKGRKGEENPAAAAQTASPHR